MMQEIKPLHINSYLSEGEIRKLLDNVDYISMVAPSMMNGSEPKLHFSFFLNTSETIPEEIRPKLLEKFCQENGITNPKYVINDLVRVSFALTSQETPMPRHMIDDAEANSVPWVVMHLIDFLGDSEEFQEAKDGLSGWSYSYN